MTLEKILQFTTAAQYEPLLGFQIQPTLQFNVLSGFLPIANTCSNSLTLPIPSSALDEMPPNKDLFEKFDYAFTSKYFGKV